MKQTKWFISLYLVLTSISAAGAKGKGETRELAGFDTIPLPSRAYSIGQEVDSILSSLSLQPFFAGLDSLRAGKDTVLTIVHLGDSHIQAGYYSGKVMRLLQAQFGNAGRGWIAPFKLSKTNEPDDYFISSSVREWITGRCIQVNKKCPVGIGGIGIQSVSPSINLDVRIAPNNGAGYSFNRAILYRGEKAMPMLPTGPRKDSVQTSLATVPAVAGVLADTFRISYQADTLQLHSTRRKQGTDELLPASSFKNIYYGLSLTNGNPGILYHSVGVNGSMYIHYTDEAYIRQLALLKPSLLIVSLGTNETFGRRFRPEEFGGQVRAFVSLVKQYMPETVILLTTPPECYKRTYVNKKRTYIRNANTQLAAKAIAEAALKEGVACWDLFAATGGKGSCVKWQKEQLMGRDRVHFTKEGYREQGTLLVRALLRSYQLSIVNGQLTIGEDAGETEKEELQEKRKEEKEQEKEQDKKQDETI